MERTSEHREQAAAHIIIGEAAFGAQVHIHLDEALVQHLRQSLALLSTQHQRFGMHRDVHLLQPLHPSAGGKLLTADDEIVTIERHHLIACQRTLFGFLVRLPVGNDELRLVLLQCLIHIQILALATIVAQHKDDSHQQYHYDSNPCRAPHKGTMLLGRDGFAHLLHRNHAPLIKFDAIDGLIHPAQIYAHILGILIRSVPHFGAWSEVAPLGKHRARHDGKKHATLLEAAVGELLHAVIDGILVDRFYIYFLVFTFAPHMLSSVKLQRLYIRQEEAVTADLQSTFP